MKNIIAIFLLLSLWACAPGTTPTQGTQTIATTSPEAEAKVLTSKMKSVLNLDASQEEKVLMINVVNKKVVKRLRETNDTSKLPSTKEKYQSEMKGVLTDDQFAKFLVEFKDM